MKIIDIYTMPIFRFAHSFEAETHEISFTPTNDSLEITYIAEGSFEVIKGTEKYLAEKGDILCGIRDVNTTVKATSFHCHHTVGVTTRWEFSDNHAYGLHLPYILKHCRESEEIINMIDEFIYASHRYQNSPARTAELFLNILCKIDNAYLKNSPSEKPEYSVLAEKAKNFIQKNINKPITQKDVADFLSISPSYLCSLFKKSEGVTLMRYVNTIKLKSIRNLMKKENIKLYEAAQLYGYTDSNYVSYLYKKIFGHNITDSSKTKDFGDA